MKLATHNYGDMAEGEFFRGGSMSLIHDFIEGVPIEFSNNSVEVITGGLGDWNLVPPYEKVVDVYRVSNPKFFFRKKPSTIESFHYYCPASRSFERIKPTEVNQCKLVIKVTEAVAPSTKITTEVVKNDYISK